MDDYVAVEAYDVMLGASYNAGGSQAPIEEPGHANATYGQSTASWDLVNGVTGKGWELMYFDVATMSVKYYNVYGTTDEEVRQNILPYLGSYGDSFIGSYGCK